MIKKISLIKIFMIGFVFSLFFSGCATKIPVKKEVGNLNLKTGKLKKSPPTEEIIAIVSPKIVMDSKVAKAQALSPQESLLSLMMRNRMLNYNYDFNAAFVNSYEKRLEKALEDVLSEIIISKGFRLKGPYASFDDITYQDKKKIYLALIPKINLHIYNKIIKRERHRLYIHTEGIIQVGGSVIISLVEPLTRQVFMKKRINLSDFNIQEPYIYEKQITTGDNSLISTVIDKASAPKQLIDTTDVALTKALNEFYTKAVNKINEYLDREEILSFKQDVLKLKGLKRY
jgi:hypothetical protein